MEALNGDVLAFRGGDHSAHRMPRYRPGSFPGECPTPGWHDEFETVSTTLLAFTFSGYNVREVSTSAGYLDE
jgi:hypothetical protein